jgi:formylglycine-generating enzyme required for sulfatase activity
MAGDNMRFSSLNDIAAREAMGLPAEVVCRTIQPPLSQFSELCFESPTSLALIAERSSEKFGRRYAAGLLMGLVGDPRISLMDPVMIDVPGGFVQLGLDSGDVDKVVQAWATFGVQRHWIVKECPRYETYLKPYRIAKYLVTNIEYLEFLEDSKFLELPTSWPFGVFPVMMSNHPVWTVTPEAADAYVNWLSARTGRNFRLPTESEWEHAACGHDEREYPWGDSYDPWRANTVEAGPLQTTPIGIYSNGVSYFGLMDMAGNVEEIVADRYAPYPAGARITDDLGTEGSYRIVRGGSFTRHGDLARCRRRHGWYSREIYAIGFRIAEEV